MKTTMRYLFALSAILLTVQAVSIAPSQARKFTITQRQEKLARMINSGQRSGALTLKEANALRGEEDRIIDKECKMKARNGGKLSYADMRNIEGRLNKLSDKLHARQLAKRVDAPTSVR